MIAWLLALLASVGATDPGCLVLGALDERRSAALEAGDAAALTDVYPSGSSLLASDRGLVEQYRARGLRLRGARLERLACSTVARGSSRYVVRVVDRLGTAQVEGSAARTLPRDRPTRRTVTIVRTEAGWRVGQVR